MDRENGQLEIAKEVFKITRGNLRLLQRLVQQTARLMEINQKDAPTNDIVRSASRLLVVGGE